MVKEHSLKYFQFNNDKGWPEQLFDLSKDPDERNNLINASAYADALSRLRAKADVLPEPRRKDENNRFIDSHRPIATPH